MNEAEIDKIIANVNGIMRIEDMPLTEENKADIRRMLRGEVTGDELIAEIEARHGITPKDPFYSESNMKMLRQSIADADAGKVTAHELIED